MHIPYHLLPSSFGPWARLLGLALLVVLLAAAALPGGVSRAQTGGGYDLTWNTVDSGYMFSTGGSLQLEWLRRPVRRRNAYRRRLHVGWRLLEQPT